MKKKWLFLVLSIIIILLGIGGLVVWKFSSRDNSVNQPTPSPHPAPRKLSQQELEKYLLEKRLDLQKYFVFNLGELTTEKLRDDYGNTASNGHVVNSQLAKDLTKLSVLHKSGNKNIIVFESDKGAGPDDEWKDEKLDKKIKKADNYFIFEKDDEVDYTFKNKRIMDQITNIVFLRTRTPTTKICESKEKALEILKTDPTLIGKV